MKSMKKNLVLSTMYQVLTMILPLITAPYASRVLGVDGMGIYSYTHSYVLYFMLLGALGTVSYGTREISRNRNNVSVRSRLFWEITCLTILTSLVSFSMWGVWILFNQQYRIYYMILSFFLLGTMFDISWFYAGMEEFRYTVTQNSIFKLLGAASIFIFVKKADDLWVYVLIMSLTAFLANISMWIYLPHFVGRIPIRDLHPEKHLKETFIYFIPTIAISVYTILDKTLIGLITQDTSENGNYEQATKIVNMAKSVCFAGVNLVLQSRSSYLFAEKKYDEIKQHILNSMDYIFFIGIAMCCGLIGIAERFVPLFFGPGYDKTIILLQLMSVLIVIVGVSNCLGSQYFTPAGLRAKSAKYIIIGACVNLILNLILIPTFKSAGAVFATIVAEGVISSLFLHNCDGYYDLTQLLSQVWKKIVAGAGMLWIIILLGRKIVNPFAAIVVQISVGALIYFSLLFVMRDSFIQNIVMRRSNTTIPQE